MFGKEKGAVPPYRCLQPWGAVYLPWKHPHSRYTVRESLLKSFVSATRRPSNERLYILFIRGRSKSFQCFLNLRHAPPCDRFAAELTKKSSPFVGRYRVALPTGLNPVEEMAVALVPPLLPWYRSPNNRRRENV